MTLLSVQQHSCKHCAVLQRCRRAGLLVSAATATRQQQRHSHVHELSMVLLVNKNLEKQLGKGLVDHSQLVNAASIIHAADYALLLVEDSRDSSCSNTSLQQASDAAWPVLYANQAAADALSSCCSSSICSDAGQVEPHSAAESLQHVHLPAAITAMIEQQQHMLQRQQPLLNEQQGSLQSLHPTTRSNSSFALLQQVDWHPGQGSGSASLTVDQLLCCHVHAPNDAYIGLALLFDAWRHADGWLGLPGWPRTNPAALPSQQQLQAAAEAVRAQADAVRQLKQVQGLGNKDPAVLEAVAALQQLKQQLAHLEGLQQAFMPGRERQLQQLLAAATTAGSSGPADQQQLSEP